MVHGAVREGVSGDATLHQLPHLLDTAHVGYRPSLLQGSDHWTSQVSIFLTLLIPFYSPSYTHLNFMYLPCLNISYLLHFYLSPYLSFIRLPIIVSPFSLFLSLSFLIIVYFVLFLSFSFCVCVFPSPSSTPSTTGTATTTTAGSVDLYLSHVRPTGLHQTYISQSLSLSFLRSLSLSFSPSLFFRSFSLSFSPSHIF